ncbi:MAG: hypothetical protein PHW92_03665 [Lutibacter sp.]|nr:hypothetical protein [Lutibacter sp.]
MKISARASVGKLEDGRPKSEVGSPKTETEDGRPKFLILQQKT